MNELPSLEQLLAETRASFETNFGCQPEKAACAPGRVNIIGEHVDYNGGFVLPMAMPMWTVVVGKVRFDRMCRLHTNEKSVDHKSYQIELPEDSESCPLLPITDKNFTWANYVLGTVHEFSQNHPLSQGFDCVISSSVPLGAGLSSSASLEAAVYTFLESMSGHHSEKVAKALACQRAEHNFANVPCGIMDQFASVLCQENHLLLLDCKTQSTTHLRFDYPDYAFLVINSGVKHNLGDGPYRKRRAMCEKVAQCLGVETLRDTNLENLHEKKDEIGEDHWKKALHVIKEINRTQQVAEILTKSTNNSDLKIIGHLMAESHESLRDLYEVSCPEVDLLVDCAMKQPGVLGARITGGGFGGCCVVLLKKSEINDVIAAVKNVYNEKCHHRKPQFFLATPQQGAKAFILS